MKAIWLVLIAPAVLSPLMSHANRSDLSTVGTADLHSRSWTRYRIDQVPVTVSGNPVAGTLQAPSGAASRPVVPQPGQLPSAAGIATSKSAPVPRSVASRGVFEVRQSMLSTASMLQPYDIVLMLLVLFGLAAFQLRRVQDSLHRPFADS